MSLAWRRPWSEPRFSNGKTPNLTTSPKRAPNALIFVFQNSVLGFREKSRCTSPSSQLDLCDPGRQGLKSFPRFSLQSLIGRSTAAEGGAFQAIDVHHEDLGNCGCCYPSARGKRGAGGRYHLCPRRDCVSRELNRAWKAKSPWRRESMQENLCLVPFLLLLLLLLLLP